MTDFVAATSGNGSGCTYVTMLTNEQYFNGVAVLIKTIRRYSQAPIHVLVTSNLSEATCRRVKSLCVLGDVIPVEGIPSPYPSSNASWSESEFTKLHLWNLVQFERIVYIDADCILTESVDELFAIQEPFAAAPDIFPPDRFNAGVLVIKPDQSVFQDMISKLGTLPSYDGGDTGFLNAYFSNWYGGPPASRLSFGYNAQRTLYWYTHAKRPGYWDSINPKKIIHYSSSPKPWELSMFDRSNMGDLEWIWWQTYMS